MPDPNLSSFIWSVADLLRGDYKQSEYGKVILPFTVLRRLDCVLEPTKAAVLAELATREKAGVNPEPFLLQKSGQLFYNTSPLDMKKLMGDQDNIKENLFAYMQAFSPAVRDIFEWFDFHTQIDRLAKSKLLYLVTEKFANIDLHPDVVSNDQMGQVFEELIRKFAELSNETAGEHFTPREVIRLMVNLLFIEDDDALTKPGIVRSLYDPTAGTGGMLSVADDHLAEQNPDARLVMYGQELNGESYAICKADMLIKGQDISNIIHGNTLSDDGLPGKQFDYMLVQSAVWRGMEEDPEGDPAGARAGGLQRSLRSRPAARQRWFAAVPDAPDFQDATDQGRRQSLWHCPERLAPVHRQRGQRGKRDSPLRAGERFTGSHHRFADRHVLQHGHQHLHLDRDQPQARAPQGQSAVDRRQQHVAEDAKESRQQTQGIERRPHRRDHSSVRRLPGRSPRTACRSAASSRTTDFGYQTITVERPERDAAGKVVKDTKGKRKGKPKPDSKLRDTENVPLGEDVDEYFQREVVPHVPDAWIDHDKTKIGYEIPFNRHFYVFKPPRELDEIDTELKVVTDRILTMIGELSQ